MTSLLALLAAMSVGADDETPTPEPPEGNYTPVPERWRPIGYGTRTSASPSISADEREDWLSIPVMHTASEITVTYMNRHSRTYQETGNSVTYSGTVNGEPILFDGGLYGVCPDGETITSDPVQIDVSAGDELMVFTRGEAAGGLVPWSEQHGIGPFSINALSDRPSVIVFGSSTARNPLFTEGFRDALIPVINASASGSTAGNFSIDALSRNMGLSPDGHGVTHALLQVGINSNGADPDPMCQGAVDLAWRAREAGIGTVHQIVWRPHTASTDGWTTVEGQTPVAAGRGIAVAWLRDGAPVTPDGRTWARTKTGGELYIGDPGHPLDGVVDYSAPVQAEENPDVFRVDYGPITSDGLHMDSTGYELGRPVIRGYAASL